MKDFLNKELVTEFFYTNSNEDRYSSKRVIINGRTYMKFGTLAATTVVALQYKVYNPSKKHSEYVTVMGVAHQNPGDVAVDTELAYEIAYQNALINPSVVLTFDTLLSKPQIRTFVYNVVNAMPEQFVKTRAELAAEEKDSNNYVRNVRHNNYYDNYYHTFKKIFNRN